MSTPPDEMSPLSKAVSEVDLKAALNAIQGQAATGYSKDLLLSLRPKTHAKAAGAEVEQVEVVTIPSCDGAGIRTPPWKNFPAPPPPTPVTPVKGAETVAITPSVVMTTEPPKKPKKKKKKSSGVNRKAAGTGFEEFFADPPATPDEYEEEQDLYDGANPFEQRIETCIQRYRARRKLDEHRSNVFTKYLMLGGVEATAKAFTGGLDKEILENSTAAEIAAIQATDYVRTGTKSSKYYDGSDDWVVDFEGVAKGFFSDRVPRVFPLDTEKDVFAITNVIRNFLNYVLQHEVCPEYTKEIMAARAICNLAETELWSIHLISHNLPGDFAIAASTLYGGQYKDFYLGIEGWGGDDPNFEQTLNLNRTFSKAKAQRIFVANIAFAGDDELFQKTSHGDIHVVKTETKFFEATKIERATIESCEAYANITDHEGNFGNIKPLGSIWYKAWEGPRFDEEDLTDEEIKAAKVAMKKAPLEKFWLEDDILQHCFEGMKVEATVHELNIGIKFIDAFNGVYCSFHTVLNNEKMTGYKEPVPNPRPPPTVDDPDLEERVMNDIMDEEFKYEEKEFGGMN